VAQARRRLIIATVEDLSGKQAGMDAQGFGILVANELSRLSELFTAFETGRTLQAIPDKLTPLSSVFKPKPLRFSKKP